MHYPLPDTPAPEGTAIPRTLSPITNKNSTLLPPETAKLISSATRKLLPGWTCSTHVCQAATPRETPLSEIQGSLAASIKELTKVERQALVDANFKRMQVLRSEIALGSKISSNDAIMWTVANRYAPDKLCPSIGPALTLIVAHATGFHKEIWETTFRYLISMTESDPHQLGIDEIWAIDAMNHGDSALLNKSNLGDIFEWSDHARDILNFVTNFLPESINDLSALNLPQVPEKVAQQRLDHGFKSRVIVGLGHSFGGCTLARAVVESPNLFSSAILVDPVIYPSYSLRSLETDGYVKGALARRDHWPDRETAKVGLLNLPFFQAWSPDVIADYVAYGMHEFEGEIRLKCPGYQEAATFSEDNRLPCEVWELLPSLDERIPLKWIMDSNNASTSSKFDETTPHTVWRRPANSSNIKIQGAGHLIPQEAPQALAHEILDFIRLQHGNRSVGAAKSKL